MLSDLRSIARDHPVCFAVFSGYSRGHAGQGRLAALPVAQCHAGGRKEHDNANN